MAKPRLLILDEPSMGLSPIIVEDIFKVLKMLNETEGLTILVAEQNSNIALRYANRAYVLETGKVALEGEARRFGRETTSRHFILAAKPMWAPLKPRCDSTGR